MSENKTAYPIQEDVQEARKTVDALAPVIGDFVEKVKAMGRQYAMNGKAFPDYFTFVEAADRYFDVESEVVGSVLQERFTQGYEGYIEEMEDAE